MIEIQSDWFRDLKSLIKSTDSAWIVLRKLFKEDDKFQVKFHTLLVSLNISLFDWICGEKVIKTN